MAKAGKKKTTKDDTDIKPVTILKESIVTKLVEEFDCDQDDLSKMSLENLEMVLQTHEAIASAKEVVADTSTMVAETPPDSQDLVAEIASRVPTPEIYSVGWSDYVMSLLIKEELVSGNPTTDGLRRLARQIFGAINFMTEVKQFPNIENERRATVVVTISGQFGSICGAADVNSSNTEAMFAVHPVAVAETRAEGRALRKLLGLRKVVAAEEMTGGTKQTTGDSMNPKVDNPNRIDTGAVGAVKAICYNLTPKIDPTKLLIVHNIGVESVEDLTKDTLKQVMSIIGKYRNKELPMPESIKADLQ